MKKLNYFRGRRHKRRKEDFQPNRNYVEYAIKEYLDRGGKIQQIVVDWDSPLPLGDKSDTDSFLRGTW